MRKETRKEFVVCKDYEDDYRVLNKGDIVFIHPVEFFDVPDCCYREDLIENYNMNPETTVDVMFVTRTNFENMLHRKDWEVKHSEPVDIMQLPYMFNTLKIQPRNITIEFED